MEYLKISYIHTLFVVLCNSPGLFSACNHKALPSIQDFLRSHSLLSHPCFAHWAMALLCTSKAAFWSSGSDAPCHSNACAAQEKDPTASPAQPPLPSGESYEKGYLWVSGKKHGNLHNEVKLLLSALGFWVANAPSYKCFSLMS